MTLKQLQGSYFIAALILYVTYTDGLRDKNVTSHVFAQTTRIVSAPHGFACVVLPAKQLHILSFVEFRSGVFEPYRSKFGQLLQDLVKAVKTA